MSDLQTTQRIEQAMEKYAPTGYDPASDDMTIPFAMELVEKDQVIAALRKANERLGSWMSAALDDPNVCAEMKADITAWFAAHEQTAGVRQPPICEGCGVNRSDPPSKLCPGCQAYREHQA